MRVVAGLQVAVLVFFVDHRLGGERLPGRRRRRRLRVDHQLAGRRRADDDRELAAEVTPPLVNWSVDGLGRVVGRLVNVATPPDDRGRRASLERAGAAGQERRDQRAVVAGHEVAELVLFVDDRLGRERLTGRGRLRRLRVDHQLASRRRADDDAGRRPGGQAAAGEAAA